VSQIEDLTTHVAQNISESQMSMMLDQNEG